MEDIVVRGGGRLVIELCRSSAEGGLSSEPIEVRVDGSLRRLEAGGRLALGPGESVCLVPGLYHRFYGEEGHGRVLVGEVSMVNDDVSDNRFLETLRRFPLVDEDEEPLWLLASDYPRFPI
jgi:D-lyxose ketol-isomerase